MLVVAVTLGLITPHDPVFMRALLANAEASRREQGCLRFEVSASEDGATVFIYEVYMDAAAFGSHRASAHYADYDRIRGPLINLREVKTYALVSSQ